MNEYEITIRRDDIPANNIQKSDKWANDENQALSYIFRNRLKKNGFGTLKRGGRAKLISIKRIK